MNLSFLRIRVVAIFLAAGICVPCLAGPLGAAANFGRLLGTVTDSQGNPLMGATVLIVGPAAGELFNASRAAERVITDAQGRFTVERLLPGLYSVRITALTRVPALRHGVSVKPGRTTQQSFMLSDIFTSLRFRVPQGNVSTWGEDWKWVLRTSPATRPILRYREVRSASSQTTSKPPRTASQHLIGLMPGGTRREALAADPGLGSVLAYLRPLSQDSDVLVAGSMTPNGLQASSVATAFRKNLLNGDPQTLSVAMHQLSFADGFGLAPGEGRGSFTRAQGVAVNYSHARRLSKSLMMTAGFEVDYLNAVRDAVMAHPSMNIEYQANRSTVVAFRYGALSPDSEGTLLERIGMLNAFPRMTLRGYRPRLENLNHAAVSLDRRLSKISRIDVAAFRDAFQDAVVWGLGGSAALGGLAGNFLPNPASGGVALDAGNYRSVGFRSVYSRSMGSHLETSFAYALGSALTFNSVSPASGIPKSNLSGVLSPQRSQSLAGRVSARVPLSHTQVVTSYEWLQQGRVTGVDPSGQATLQMQPFLGVQIRQPLPTLAFLPAHIEALADFRNLLAQGYVPISQTGEKSLLLTSGYRSFRGGFSVQF